MKNKKKESSQKRCRRAGIKIEGKRTGQEKGFS